jgi:hypothetical protein
MFQFPRFPPPKGYPAITPGGLPHSEISGSPAASASPEHFVAWPRPSSASSAKASTVCPSFRSIRRPDCSTPRLHPARLVPRRDNDDEPTSPAFLGRKQLGLLNRFIHGRTARMNPLFRPVPSPVGPGCPNRPSSLNCQGALAGGAAGARTPNLRRARAALSRLSYDPISEGRWARLDSNQGPRPYQGRALTS